MPTKAKGGRPRRIEDRFIDRKGYVQVRVGDEWIYEHRLVAMAMLGRPLLVGEAVRHRNGVRSDNGPENLEITIGRIRRGAAANDVRCPHCLQPWLAEAPSTIVMRLDDVARNLREGLWSVAPASPSGFSEPFQKLAAVTVALRPQRSAPRLSETPGQVSIFEAMGAEVA